MPFKSKRQMRWAYATGKRWASTWSKHTKNAKRLPERVRRRKRK